MGGPGPNEDAEPAVPFGYWIVGFIDLLGQRDALRKTDFLPDQGDPESVAKLMAAVKESVGVIKGMYRHFDTFLSDHEGKASPVRPEAEELIARVNKVELKRVNYADGIMLYCRLTASENHYPPYAVNKMLAMFGSCALLQLAKGKPIRGGIDVGTGIEVDGQLFGASVVKAYELESQAAKYPRIVLGQQLREYLEATAAQQVESNDPLDKYEVLSARRALGLVALDEDENWILDYLGATFHDDLGARLPVGVVHDAHQFVKQSVRHWQSDEKLSSRYKWLARYFARNVPRWQWNPVGLPPVRQTQPQEKTSTSGALPPAKGLVAGLAALRASGWRGAVKVRVTISTRARVVLEFVELNDGAWQLYGKADDPTETWRREFSSIEELDTYVQELRPDDVTVLARVAMRRSTGKMRGRWEIQLCEVAEVVRLVGEETFVAFLKCYVGADRLKTLLQWYVYSRKAMPLDAPAGDRSFHLSWLLTAGTLHELGDALQELCNSKVYFKLIDKAVWEPLDALRAKWRDHPMAARFRHQGGHHFGKKDVYVRGLSELGRACLDTAFQVGEGQDSYGDVASCAWDVLLRGIATATPDGKQPELEVADLRTFLEEANKTHRQLHDALGAVFDEVLRSAGVKVVHQATD